MLVISVTLGTRYAYKIYKISKFSNIASISSHHQKRLQAYLVPYVINIASILSPPYMLGFNLNLFHKKYQCEIQNKCAAYTFDKSRMICVLHANLDKGTTKKRRKQTGVKKADYTLSLPEMNFCSNKNRQKRCKRESKCRHANCIRNAEKWQSRKFRVKTIWRNLFLYFLYFSCVFFNADKRKFGYDAGYMKDEYGCNLSKCKCATFDQTVIGKFVTS